MACPPPHGAVCRAHVPYPAFAPCSSEVAVGFFIFLYLVVHNLPQLRRQLLAVTFRPFSFFVFCCSEEAFVQVPALQPKVPGPPVSLLGDEIGGCLAPTSCGTLDLVLY